MAVFTEIIYLKKLKNSQQDFSLKFLEQILYFHYSIIMVIIIVNIIVTFKVVRYLKVPKLTLLILNGSAI